MFQYCAPISFNVNLAAVFSWALLVVSFQDMGTEVEDSSESIQEFQMILDELVGDESMDKVRAEYEKLIQVLIKSRENEKRLMSKCRELNAKIVSTTTKVADALKMRQEDETKMNFLKRVRLYARWKKSFPLLWSWFGSTFKGFILLCHLLQVSPWFLCRSLTKPGKWLTWLMKTPRRTKKPSGL